MSATPADAQGHRSEQGRAVIVVDSGSLAFGFDVDRVAEVIEFSAVTPIPLAPAHILGLVNWHGKPIPLVSFELFLSLPVPPQGVCSRALVLSGEAFTVAVCAAHVRGVVEHASPLCATPLATAERLAPYLVGTLDLGSEAIFLFDVLRLLRDSRLRA